VVSAIFKFLNTLSESYVCPQVCPDSYAPLLWPAGFIHCLASASAAPRVIGKVRGNLCLALTAYLAHVMPFKAIQPAQCTAMQAATACITFQWNCFAARVVKRALSLRTLRAIHQKSQADATTCLKPRRLCGKRISSPAGMILAKELQLRISFATCLIHALHTHTHTHTHSRASATAHREADMH